MNFINHSKIQKYCIVHQFYDLMPVDVFSISCKKYYLPMPTNYTSNNSSFLDIWLSVDNFVISLLCPLVGLRESPIYQ